MNEDFSNIFDKLNIDPNSISPDMINNLMGMLNSNKTETSSDSSNSTNANNSNTQNIDVDTILKMKSIMEKMNADNNNPRNNLLFALKPYLTTSKQDKLNQYIKISKIIDILPYLGEFNKHNE